MKTVHRLSVLLLCGSSLFSVSVLAEDTSTTNNEKNLAASSNQVATTKIDRNKLVGAWTCEHTVIEPKTKFKVRASYKVNYSKDGTSSGDGNVWFTISPGMPEIQYNIVDNANWELKGKNALIMRSTDLTYTNVSHPQFDKLFNLRPLLPKEINESGNILTLNNKKLVIKSELRGQTYTCKKIEP